MRSSPVASAHCDYKRPAYYEDLLAIEVEVTELKRASMVFGYRVRRHGELIASGWTRHAVIGPTGRPRALPDDLVAGLVVRELRPD